MIDEKVLHRIVKAVLPKDSGISDFNLDASEFDNVTKNINTRLFNLNSIEFKSSTLERNVLEDSRVLRDIATDLVNKEFLRSEDCFYNFISIVYRSFDKMLSIYRRLTGIEDDKVFFVYKGGNLMRFISNEFLSEFPYSASQKLEDFYSKYFSKSDSDFSIYINPNVDNYDDVYYECGLMSYLLQDKIRNEFNLHTNHYFDFFNNSDEYISTRLKMYLDLFNVADNFKDVFNDIKIKDKYAVGGRYYPYSPNQDKTIKFSRNDEDWKNEDRAIVIGNIKLPTTFMTITHNDALDFSGTSGVLRNKFNLTRTKIIFTCMTNQGILHNIGGELIDVSIPHKLTSDIHYMFDNMKDSLASYTLTLKSKEDIVVRGQSLYYIIHDLERILFIDAHTPWDDIKYSKRLNRLIYFYYIDVFIVEKNSINRINVINDLYLMVFLHLRNIDYDKTMGGILSYNEKYGNKFKITTFTKYVQRMIEDKSIKENTTEMSLFSQYVIDNIKYLLDTLVKVKDYCKTDGNVMYENLYKLDVKNII